MDIQNHFTPADRSRETYVQQQRALIDACRALVRAAGDDLVEVARQQQAHLREARAPSAESGDAARPRQDELQLSAAALKASNESASPEREARIRDLAEAHRMDRLHTPERIERAAQRLLEGS